MPTQDSAFYSLHDVIDRLKNKTEIARVDALLRHLRDGRLKTVVHVLCLSNSQFVEVGAESWHGVTLEAMVSSKGTLVPGFTLAPEIALAQEKTLLRSLVSKIERQTEELLLGPAISLPNFPPLPTYKEFSRASRAALISRGIFELASGADPDEWKRAQVHCEQRLTELNSHKQRLQPLVTKAALVAWSRRSSKAPATRKGGRPVAYNWSPIFEMAIEHAPLTDDNVSSVVSKIVAELAPDGKPGRKWIAKRLKPLNALTAEEARRLIPQFLTRTKKCK